MSCSLCAAWYIACWVCHHAGSAWLCISGASEWWDALLWDLPLTHSLSIARNAAQPWWHLRSWHAQTARWERQQHFQHWETVGILFTPPHISTFPALRNSRSASCLHPHTFQHFQHWETVGVLFTPTHISTFPALRNGRRLVYAPTHFNISSIEKRSASCLRPHTFQHF